MGFGFFTCSGDDDLSELQSIRDALTALAETALPR